jgi:hypothetical protein
MLGKVEQPTRQVATGAEEEESAASATPISSRCRRSTRRCQEQCRTQRAARRIDSAGTLGSSSPSPASAMASSAQPHGRRRCYTGNHEGRLALPRQLAVRAAPVEALEIASGSSRACRRSSSPRRRRSRAAGKFLARAVAGEADPCANGLRGSWRSPPPAAFLFWRCGHGHGHAGSAARAGEGQRPMPAGWGGAVGYG